MAKYLWFGYVIIKELHKQGFGNNWTGSLGSLQLACSGPSDEENYHYQLSLCFLEGDLVIISAFVCVLPSVGYGAMGVYRGKIWKTLKKNQQHCLETISKQD